MRICLMVEGQEDVTGAEWVALADACEEAIVGTVDEAVVKLGDLERAGPQRVMLQHQTNDDVAMVGLLDEIACRLP